MRRDQIRLIRQSELADLQISLGICVDEFQNQKNLLVLALTAAGSLTLENKKLVDIIVSAIVAT